MLVNSRDVCSHQCCGHPEDNLKSCSDNEGVRYKHGFIGVELTDTCLFKSPLCMYLLVFIK